MTIIRVPKAWELPEARATSANAYFNRRRLLKNLANFSLGAGIVSVLGCKGSSAPNNTLVSANPALTATLELPSLEPFTRNPTFQKVDRPITDEVLAGQYNNYYEFGGSKSIWRASQALPIDNWQVEVTGLVKNPRTYDLEDLLKKFPLEERVYRMRCVEAWSMVLPWVGFPMKLLMAEVEPTDKAKFVSFTSYYDREISLAPVQSLGQKVPWPYTEGLHLKEMANELAFFAVGIYGERLPKQHGAPIRAVLPWKYGFKGAKSIVKIDFVEEQPATFWNILAPSEYGFVDNVNPNKPHPRWSQKKERFIGTGSEVSWEERPTLPYNGYEEFVASLYK
ncbi:MAG: protein-methionine-sulfoxide reductase catalytic subunit MsrP [Symploca sp. SIO1C2]|nr:protein-methionine-sulfoxide reductase catalytic subunit MsrP [Symploca sp. SIO1C2]